MTHIHDHEHTHLPGSRHTHPHIHHTDQGEGRLVLSIILNLLITIAEVVGGLLSGSLALLSDALHNFSDTTSLAVSLVAVRISGRLPDRRRTFGYRRAQIVGAFFNLVTLVIIALFLIREAVGRYLDPQPIDGAIMMWVALIGLIANLLTAWLLYRQARLSLNIRSAFIHIVSDAVSSVGVVIGGLAIMIYGVYLVDTLLTVAISVYILVHTFIILRQTIRILMQSVPEGMNLEEVAREVRGVEGVQDVHHIHVWQLDETSANLEAHLVLHQCDFEQMARVKSEVKQRLQQVFNINHTTLEVEFSRCDVCVDDNCYDIRPGND